MLRIGPIPLTAAWGFVFAVAALDDVGAAAVVAQPGTTRAVAARLEVVSLCNRGMVLSLV